eukprot:symbB.v1.2.015919.t1/scaffold1202.1/size131747/3
MGGSSRSWQLCRLLQAGRLNRQSNWFLTARFARTSSSAKETDNPFPDLNKEPGKAPSLPKKPVWDDDTEWEAGLEKAVPARRKVIERSPVDDLGDFIISIAVRRKMTGYALLRFRDLLPLQFGIVDVSKHGTKEGFGDFCRSPRLATGGTSKADGTRSR